jgi:LexA DNA binding domain-containing protein
MGRSRSDTAGITKEVAGKAVSHVSQPDAQRINVHFTDESILAIEVLDGHITAVLNRGASLSAADRRHGGLRPTRRQQDYLDFIARYIRRYGVSPAELDIARHFLVSAPSANQMVQMLERRGFIKRQPGIPRSITVVDDLKNTVGLGQADVARDPRPNNALHRTGARGARPGR